LANYEVGSILKASLTQQPMPKAFARSSFVSLAHTAKSCGVVSVAALAQQRRQMTPCTFVRQNAGFAAATSESLNANAAEFVPSGADFSGASVDWNLDAADFVPSMCNTGQCGTRISVKDIATRFKAQSGRNKIGQNAVVAGA
jgi:hypothetical protein